jgi:hypothetical protein
MASLIIGIESLMERYKKNIEKTVARWQTVMDLGFITVKNYFSDEAPEHTAEVITNWEYREAAIIWYQSAAELTQDELDEAAIHELGHILVAPMSDHLPSKHHKLEEFCVQSIARAILGVHRKS